MLQMVVGGGLSGMWVGVGRHRCTNLLLRDVIELYPDLLLGRRGVTVKNEDGRWRKGNIQSEAAKLLMSM